MAILLSKEERAVMQAIYELADHREKVLVSLEDIMGKIKPVRKLRRKSAAEGTTESVPEDASAAVSAEDGAAAAEGDGADGASPVSVKRRHFWQRHKEENEQIPAVEMKTYVDESPVVKGMFVYEKPVKYADMPHILEILDMEEYFVLTEARKGNEIKYVVELENRGRRWERDENDRKRTARMKLVLTVATPILSFIFGILLRVLFD